MVRWRRVVRAGKEFLGEQAKRLGSLPIVVEREDGHGRRQIVLLQIRVQARARSAKIRDACACVENGLRGCFIKT